VTSAPDAGTDRLLSRVLADPDARRVVLAGPGVVHEGAIGGLRAFAAAANVGVANTFGAKGVFNWDSPHHLGTVGLQARDFELLGFAERELIIATGLDRLETRGHFALAPVRHVVPRDLAALATVVVACRQPIPPNDLYTKLSAIAQPGYVDDKVPLHPARAVVTLGQVMPPGALVTATPGVAGLWVARTFPTPALEPGGPQRVIVPAARHLAPVARRALEAARAERPTALVTTAPVTRALRRELVVDRTRGTALPAPLLLVVWSEDATRRSPEELGAALTDALATPGLHEIDVAVALDDTRHLVEAAGPVVAWGGLER
jgi:thiamine pyrophosphate-dependent acetolactate synthase large subunit-like protein